MVIAAASIAKLVPTTVGRAMATNTTTTAGVAVAVKSGVAVSGIAFEGNRFCCFQSGLSQLRNLRDRQGPSPFQRCHSMHVTNSHPWDEH
jgi:hypothetical protein